MQKLGKFNAQQEQRLIRLHSEYLVEHRERYQTIQPGRSWRHSKRSLETLAFCSIGRFPWQFLKT